MSKDELVKIITAANIARKKRKIDLACYSKDSNKRIKEYCRHNFRKGHK